MRALKGKKTEGKLKTSKLPFLVLALSLLLTGAATFLFYNSSAQKDSARFQNEVIRIDAGINNKIRTYIAMLKSGRGFIETVGEVNRDSFRTYVSSLDLRRNYQGVQGIGYAKRILSYEAETLAQRMESEGFKNFRVFPQNTAKYDYIAVLYLEPLDERNRRAIGFDVSSEDVRRMSLEKAATTGEPVATGKVFLVVETEEDKQPGFLISLPIYKGDRNPQDAEERKRFLDGYVYGAFRANNFLAEVRNTSNTENISITIYDAEADYKNILAQTHNYVADTGSDFTARTETVVAGRKWIIEYKALPGFVAESNSGWTPLILGSGLVFSLLLFGMTYLESFARRKSERFTHELRESEKEKALLFEKEQKARRFAEDASRAKDEFISVVSHELRTPLNTIAGWTRLLQADSLAPEMKQQALEKIDKNLRIQTKLVEELLDFSQIITGKGDLNSRLIEISTVFENAVANVSAQAREKEISIEKQNSLNGQKILGDSERLKKAFENVLRNAVKFTSKNGTVFTEIKERDDAIEMKIRDSGRGISPKFLPHIFEGFRQADSSSTRQFGGLGLGLAISRHILELHGGSITAESAGEGKGAVFTIKIPVSKDSDQPSEPPQMD
ncbi:MAG TPA: CHASE domain-containing protein [Pyrinomonadaceae bacterium]|nr:CHASE domain-containing protein [Pyrinomonadaceae bacterium]